VKLRLSPMNSSNGSLLIRLGYGFRDILVNRTKSNTAVVAIDMPKMLGGKPPADECLSKDPMAKLGRCVIYMLGLQNALTTTLIQRALYWSTPLMRGELTKTRMSLRGSKNRRFSGFNTTPLAASVENEPSQGVETPSVRLEYLTSVAPRGLAAAVRGNTQRVFEFHGLQVNADSILA
jgi:hypothetical protein